MKRIHLLLLLSYIVLVLTGCPNSAQITPDKLVGLPEYIHSLKENIAFASECERIKGQPPIFALGGTSIKFTTAVTKGETGVTIGVVPVSMGFTPNLTAQETQEVVINLTPIQISPRNVDVTFTGKDKPEKWKRAEIVTIGANNYLWGRNEQNEEVWVEMKGVQKIQVSGSATNKIMHSEDEIKKRCFGR